MKKESFTYGCIRQSHDFWTKFQSSNGLSPSIKDVNKLKQLRDFHQKGQASYAEFHATIMAISISVLKSSIIHHQINIWWGLSPFSFLLSSLCFLSLWDHNHIHMVFKVWHTPFFFFLFEVWHSECNVSLFAGET